MIRFSRPATKPSDYLTVTETESISMGDTINNEENRAEKFYRERFEKAVSESQPPMPGSEEYERLRERKEATEKLLKQGPAVAKTNDPQYKLVQALLSSL